MRSEDEEQARRELGEALVEMSRSQRPPQWLDQVLTRALEAKYGQQQRPAQPDPKESE